MLVWLICAAAALLQLYLCTRKQITLGLALPIFGLGLLYVFYMTSMQGALLSGGETLKSAQEYIKSLKIILPVLLGIFVAIKGYMLLIYIQKRRGASIGNPDRRY